MTLKVTFPELLTSVEGFSLLRKCPCHIGAALRRKATPQLQEAELAKPLTRGFLVRRVCQLPALSKSGEIICGFSDHTPMPGYCKYLDYKLIGVKPCS